jgi:ABC-type polysaccharide/polyol phosphate export permease
MSMLVTSAEGVYEEVEEAVAGCHPLQEGIQKASITVVTQTVWRVIQRLLRAGSCCTWPCPNRGTTTLNLILMTTAMLVLVVVLDGIRLVVAVVLVDFFVDVFNVQPAPG